MEIVDAEKDKHLRLTKTKNSKISAISAGVRCTSFRKTVCCEYRMKSPTDYLYIDGERLYVGLSSEVLDSVSFGDNHGE